jgi:hypothetical protein
MLELNVFTTDLSFVEDLNFAKIEGISATYRPPSMAYDSAEQVFDIVVSASSSIGLGLVTNWIYGRFRTKPPKELTINNQTIINAENVHIVINNYLDAQSKKSDGA